VRLNEATELQRLNALRRYAILDTPPEGVFDRITALAADLLDVPIAVVSLVDSSRVWYKSVHGPLAEREAQRLPGFCGAAVAEAGPYVVEDTRRDPRTRDLTLARGPAALGFYVGVPLRTHDGHVLGLLACMDRRPRPLSDRDLRHLDALAAIVMDEIELRQSAREISRMSEVLAEACDQLERRASTDSLTGVLARPAVLARAPGLIERAAAGKGAALLMLDIDHFKAINDGHGHASGDRVLAEVATRMGASCRAGDLLGRLGGEEFLALFAGVGEAEAVPIADRLREAVAQPAVLLCDGVSRRVTVSGGLVTLQPEACHADSLGPAMERADAALYRAKAEGRDRIVRG